MVSELVQEGTVHCFNGQCTGLYTLSTGNALDCTLFQKAMLWTVHCFNRQCAGLYTLSKIHFYIFSIPYILFFSLLYSYILSSFYIYISVCVCVCVCVCVGLYRAFQVAT
jgi:hypothetical protein